MYSRRRNMSDQTKRDSAKWQRALRTMDWLVAQLNLNGYYQLYSFNTQISSAITGSENQWLAVEDQVQLEQAMLNLQQLVPEGGTSLHRAFAISKLDPLPDNILLLTDIYRPKEINLLGEILSQVPSDWNCIKKHSTIYL